MESGPPEVQEQQESESTKRGLGNGSNDVDMATATLPVHQESNVGQSSHRMNNGCPEKSGSSRRRSQRAKQKKKNNSALRQMQAEHAESSAVNSSPSPPAPTPPTEVGQSASITDPSTLPDAGRDENNSLIPGLTDHLALVILAMVPLSYHQPLKGVCRKWRRSLSSSSGSIGEVLEMRKFLGLTENWVFLLASGGQQIQAQWRAFDPVNVRWRWLPQCPWDYTFDSCDKESAVAGTQLLVSGHSSAGPTIWRYDLHTNEWSKAPKMIQSRCLFASASFGKHAYFAGGSCEGNVLKCAERYDSLTQEWEALPDLHVSRKWCSGCILDGKFCVIGGQGGEREALTSGEYFDESQNRWVVVDNMWPAKLAQPPGTTAPPLVAVVDNQLFAADASTMELNAYHKGTNSWRTLGPVPYRSVDSSGWGMGFKAVGKEIFVIGGSRGSGHFCDQIHGWPPAQMEQVWRQVGQLQNTSGFIYNCAVMVA